MRSILHALAFLTAIAMAGETARSQTVITGPGPHFITAPGDYVVIGDIVGIGNGIVVQADDVHIDLSQGTVRAVSFIGPTVGIDITDQFNVHIDGHGTGTIQSSGIGIRIQGGGGHHVNAVNVRDMTIQLFNGFILIPFTGTGILVQSSTNNHINGNTIVDNDFNGIELNAGSGNRITGNTCTNNGTGPLFFFNETAGGVFLNNTSGNTLQGNDLSGNSDFGLALVSSHGNTITGSIANGNINAGFAFNPSPTPGIAMKESDNNIVRGNTANDNSIGIEVGSGSDGNLVQGNTTDNNKATGGGFFPLPATAYAGGKVGSGISLAPFSVFPFPLPSPAENNTVRGNFSSGNDSFDMSDGNLNCGTNKWLGNTFDTANMTCIK